MPDKGDISQHRDKSDMSDLRGRYVNLPQELDILQKVGHILI